MQPTQPDNVQLSEAGVAILRQKLGDPRCKRGIKALQKNIPQVPKGVVVLAQDITPFDLISHLPGLCKAYQLPLRYIPSRFDLTTNKGKPVTCLLLPESMLTPGELTTLTQPAH